MTDYSFAQKVPDAGMLEDRQLDLDQRAHAIDIAFASCSSLNPTTKAQWASFYPAYVARAAQALADIGSSGTLFVLPATYIAYLKRIQAEQVQDQIAVGQFAHVANVTCGANIDEGPPPPPPSAADYLKWGTYLALGLGGLYVLGIFGPTIAGFLPRARRRRS